MQTDQRKLMAKYCFQNCFNVPLNVIKVKKISVPPSNVHFDTLSVSLGVNRILRNQLCQTQCSCLAFQGGNNKKDMLQHKQFKNLKTCSNATSTKWSYIRCDRCLIVIQMKSNDWDRGPRSSLMCQIQKWDLFRHFLWNQPGEAKACTVMHTGT